MEGQVFQIVQWIVGVLLGGGALSAIGMFIFYKAKKRTENANAYKAENEAVSSAIDNKTKYYKAQDEIINNLMNEVRTLTAEVIACTKASKKLESRVSDLELLAESNHRKIEQLTNERCIVEDCPKRNPPIITEQKCKKCNGEIGEQL